METTTEDHTMTSTTIGNLVEKMQQQFKKMCETGKLFRAKVSGDEIYDKYLASFPEGTNPVFRDPESSYHNCNNCKNFIRRYGNIVAVNSNMDIETIFNVSDANGAYGVVAKELDNLIKSKEIENVFFETYEMLDQKLNYEKCTKSQSVYRLGTACNHKRYTREEAEKYGVVKPNEVRTFHHMHVDIPAQYVDKSGNSIEQIMGVYRDKYQVFKRAMEEISLDTLNLVEDLINQGSLLDGTAHLHTIKDAVKYKTEYDKLRVSKENWLWTITYSLDERTAKFKNTLVGVLCSELSTGEELNKACESWNKRVDPVNYHKASAPITKKQIAEAQKFVEENGYTESFNRRLATIDDINVTEIKHISSGTGAIPAVTIFDNVKATATQHKRAKYDDVEEVSIEKFMEDILPKCTSVEALLLNRHEGNLVTMTTTKSTESKPIFKWNNNYSWTFNGNLAGKSQIKEAVGRRGGKVDGVLRFSIMWAEGDPSDNSDLDAWCEQPNRERIGFSCKVVNTGGNLDVDITTPNSYHNKGIVENITWPAIKRMPNGTYKFWINQYANRGSKGFRAEIEFNGEIYQYEYNRPVSGNVMVAEVTLQNGEFTIKHLLPESTSNKELWGLETNQFHKVNLVCLSPNHWGDNQVGNKHYMFMLEGCKTTSGVRGFHNENLLPDLLKHRKVMEVLGATNTIKVEPTDKQLSGIGFNSTVHDELVVKIQGSHKRMLKIKF